MVCCLPPSGVGLISKNNLPAIIILIFYTQQEHNEQKKIFFTFSKFKKKQNILCLLKKQIPYILKLNYCNNFFFLFECLPSVNLLYVS